MEDKLRALLAKIEASDLTRDWRLAVRSGDDGGPDRTEFDVVNEIQLLR